MKFDDLIYEYLSYVNNLISIFYRNKVSTFRSFIYHDKNDIVPLWNKGYPDTKIHRNHLPFGHRNVVRLQETCWVTMVKLHLLTFKTFSNELDNITFHACPKENFLCVSKNFLYTWMCTIQCSVGFFKDGVSNIPTIRDIHPSMES